jgi:S-adenosylmethionine:tRNA ribosyltransferase-isomerase
MNALHLTRTSKPIPTSPLEFHLPPDLEAHEPPEARGLARDEVRLLVSHKQDDSITHTTFRDVASFLEAGDVLVVNTSGTLPAALNAARADGTPLHLHLSTHLPGDVWVVEPRALEGSATKPLRADVTGETLSLAGGTSARLLAPYAVDRLTAPDPTEARLWLAVLELPEPLLAYLERFGKPIRYGYVPREYPLEFYQTVYATEQGSAEMPSAGRAFTPEIITRLTARGVTVAPLLLHTGVASLEDHEPPYEEFYRVPAPTARAVTEAHAEGRRVIAVGTTVVRALETVTDARGTTHAGEGWTRLVVTPQRGARAVSGLLTGWHEPKASHLMMLEAIAGKAHLDIAYRAALEGRYLWHEFGDLHLILP